MGRFDPYASPRSSGRSRAAGGRGRRGRTEPTEAERQIGFVIRIFRYIGWPFSVLSTPVAMLTIGVAVHVATVHPEYSVGEVLLLCLSVAVVPGYFIMLLVAARLMKQGTRSAGVLAGFLSLPMLLGFPLFTVVGVMCLLKIARYYGEYAGI